MLLVTKNLAELCTLVIDDIYGELPSRIFAALLNHGRSGVSQLAQYTSLTPRQLRHGLAVLIQYNLLYYQVPEGDGATMYEANPEAAYNVLRSGKVLEMVEGLYGVDAKDVIQSLLALGHTRIADLKDAYAAKIAKWEASLVLGASENGENGVNGTSEANGDEDAHDAPNRAHAPATAIRSMSHLNAVLCRLIAADIVEVVDAASFQSFSDRRYQTLDHIERTYFPDGIRGQKKKDEFETRVAEHLQALREEPRKLKRMLQAHGHGRQKLRKLVNGDVAHGYESSERDPLLDAKTIVRVNHERCAVELRNQRLVQAAAAAIGETTAQVYGALLQQLTENLPRCQANPLVDIAGSEYLRARQISTDDVFEHLGPTVDVFQGIGKAAAHEIDVPTAEHLERHARVDALIVGSGGGDGSGGEEDMDSDEEDYDSEGEVHLTPMIRDGANGNGAVNGNGTNGTNGSNANGTNANANGSRVKFAEVTNGHGQGHGQGHAATEEMRLQSMRQHLLLLCDHRLGFLRHCERGRWTVDFEALVRRLREAELDNAIARKAGRTGLRLARILRDKGKLDEKTLPTMALMKKGEVQNKMLEMQMHGFVDMQEVPRDNNRSASRTLFLWYCDPARAQDALLDHAYKAMVRCLRIRDVHRAAARDVLAFVERPDVKGREREALEKKYYDRYQQYCDIETKVVGQVLRLDRLVATLRDF